MGTSGPRRGVCSEHHHLTEWLTMETWPRHVSPTITPIPHGVPPKPLAALMSRELKTTLNWAKEQRGATEDEVLDLEHKLRVAERRAPENVPSVLERLADARSRAATWRGIIFDINAYAYDRASCD